MVTLNYEVDKFEFFYARTFSLEAAEIGYNSPRLHLSSRIEGS